METVSVALVCTVLGAIISYFTFQRNKTNDIRADTREETEIKTKLDYIVASMDEIRLDNKARDREFKEMASRLAKVEESTKSAHKRIDKMEGK